MSNSDLSAQINVFRRRGVALRPIAAAAARDTVSENVPERIVDSIDPVINGVAEQLVLPKKVRGLSATVMTVAGGQRIELLLCKSEDPAMFLRSRSVGGSKYIATGNAFGFSGAGRF